MRLLWTQIKQEHRIGKGYFFISDCDGKGERRRCRLLQGQARKTHPITKSNAKLNQRKNIVGPHKFRDLGPRVDVTQRLENLLEKLSTLESQKQDLLTQKQLLEKAGKDTATVSREIVCQERVILRQKVLIKKLGGKEHG